MSYVTDTLTTAAAELQTIRTLIRLGHPLSEEVLSAKLDAVIQRLLTTASHTAPVPHVVNSAREAARSAKL